MKNVEIVIFANSLKHHQHCVAGKCISSGNWIRPVADQNGSELSNEQAKCLNPHGTFSVKPLQKVIMSFSEHVPLAHQPENYLIDGSKWLQNYKIPDVALNHYLDNPKDLWGESDRLLHTDIISCQIVVKESLYLVAVDNLTLYKNKYDKRRASFSYNGTNYDLAVTDPNFDKIIQNNNTVKGVLCVSLGEEYQGYCYKIVATIF